MNTELPSKYDPSAVEAQAYKVWMDEKCFHAEPAKAGDGYSIVIPPPNVTGALHLGHAINSTLQDILVRLHRMNGFNTLWVPGIDHAGIATQAVVEKQLKEQENKTRHDVGREGLVQRIWTWKQQYGDRILEQLKRMGCSCDWDRTRFTLDEMCAKAVRETFFKLFKDGLIYRGKRLVNWDTFLQTSISDDEIYHETVKTSLWHIRYPIEGGAPAPSPLYSGERDGVRGDSGSEHDQRKSADGPSPQPSPPSTGERETENAHATFMIVATTRPETMLGDTAVAVHSEDPRWNWAIGKHVRLPLTNRLIPIIADDILVDPKFGTGVVKVTPAHDPNDYAVWQRHKGQPDEIDLINILTPDGKITSDRPEWSKYAGMKRAAARTQVVEDLKAAGLLEKEEPYETQVGHSDRSKTPVEPYLSDQWFVKMAPLAEPALEVVRNGTIKFYPERHAQQYLSWLGEKRDWPVSRQLWWGHRIPVWYIEKREPGPVLTILFACGLNGRFHWADGTQSEFLCTNDEGVDHVLRTLADLIAGKISKAEAAQQLPIKHENPELFVDLALKYIIRLEQDPDVLDTWFSSALWPHSTLGWPEKTPELAKYYPTSVLLTGRDIITLWVARMVMMGMYNMGESGTGGPPVSSSAEPQDHGRAAHATESPAPSPLYSGERDGVRGDSGSERDQRNSADGPSPQPSPLSTGERGQENATRNTGVPPVREARDVERPHLSKEQSPPHGRDARVTREEARALGIPFFDVAINPTILDGKGERMSKSKGNGVDPVDIIDSYGADALRFTLTKMATETQDARMPVKRDASGKNTSEKFDEGRNFCNKLWNACRFALSNLEAAISTSADAGSPIAQDASAKTDPTLIASGASGLEAAPLGKTSDEDLMLRTQQGDKLAFAHLYERYSASVLAFLYRALGNVEEVESVGQEVFLRAFRFAATYQYPHKFSTWLMTITRNLAITQSTRRKGSRIRNITELDFKGIDLSGNPYEVAARATDDLKKQEEIARVLKALDTLPPDQKEVIVLGVFQDLNYAEMTEKMGVDATTLRSRMFDGLKKLAHTVQESGESPDSAAPEPALTLADRWIIARFHRTLEECNAALKQYRFDVYAKSCYDFFWRDFCDWYVEAIKPAMKDPARAPQTADVLAAVLDGSLRLMHPMIPFITETVWWRLNDVRPVRGIPGVLECPPSKRLVLAQWPSVVARASSLCPEASLAAGSVASDMGWKPMLLAEKIFPKLQEVISAIRTIRNDYQVNPKQTVATSIKAPADFVAQIESNRELIELLGTCSLKQVSADLAPVANAVTASAAGCDIFVEGVIDPNAEKLRLTKEIETRKKHAASMEAKIGNEAYVAKAPPQVVQQTRDQLAATKAEIAKMEESLRKLGQNT